MLALPHHIDCIKQQSSNVLPKSYQTMKGEMNNLSPKHLQPKF